jgi:hypothetical protein
MPVRIIDASGKLLQIKIRGSSRRLTMTGSSRLRRKRSRGRKNQGAHHCRSVRRMGAEGGLGRCELHDGGRSTYRKNGIVGDEKWRDDALAFTAQRISPHRHRVPASRMNEARIWPEFLASARWTGPIAKLPAFNSSTNNRIPDNRTGRESMLQMSGR